MWKILIIINVFFIISCTSNEVDNKCISINPSLAKSVVLDDISTSQTKIILDDSLHLIGDVVKMLKIYLFSREMSL